MNILAILLLFVPAAIAAEFLHAGPVVVFGLSALAIVPLSGYLGLRRRSRPSPAPRSVGSSTPRSATWRS